MENTKCRTREAGEVLVRVFFVFFFTSKYFSYNIVKFFYSDLNLRLRVSPYFIGALGYFFFLGPIINIYIKVKNKIFIEQIYSTLHKNLL